MKISFALVLTAFVGSALGAVIPRGDGPDNSVGNWNGDDGFGSGWFEGSHQQSSEKNRGDSLKGEQNQHQGEDYRKDMGKTNDYKTHDGTDDIDDKETIKGTKQATGKEMDENQDKDHSDEDKKSDTTYFAPANGNGNQRRGDGDGDGSGGDTSKGDGKGDGNGGGNGNIKETGSDDHIVQDHDGASRQQKEINQNEQFEGDRDRKEHKVDHDTDKKQSQNQSEQAHQDKDNNDKWSKDQNESDKQGQKDTFEGFGNFGDFDDNFNGWKRALK